MTTSLSCSIAPDSLRSLRIGRLSGRCSGARLSCEIAIMLLVLLLFLIRKSFAIISVPAAIALLALVVRDAHDGVEEVYDLTVEDHHNFVAADMLVHNSIEQDSDVVMFLYRPEYYKSEERPGIAEVIIAKHRNGPTGTIELKFRRDHTRFYNLETRRPEPGTE